MVSEPDEAARLAGELARELAKEKPNSWEWCHEVDRITEAAKAKLRPLIAQVEELQESLHLANGVAQLAMKHRDAAEADNLALQEILNRK